jgi:DNA-binding transcriptional LysR family regulator
MTLWQLKVFATVAREGSFTKAGKVLKISQPSVSALVTGLQKELEAILFERLGTRTHLTEAGARLFDLVKSALAAIERIPQELDKVNGLNGGSLAVGGSAFAGSTLLPIVVRAFKKSFPSTDIKVTIEGSPVLERKLLSGDLDVALLGQPARASLLVAKPFRKERIVAFIAPNHPLARIRSVPLELVAKEPLIIEARGATRDKVEALYEKNGFDFAPELVTNTIFGTREAIKTAVANGLGIAFVSEHQVTLDVKAGRLKILNVPNLGLNRAMYLVVHKARQNPLLQRFIDFLHAYKER